MILIGFHTSWAAALFDFDGDGKTDPVVTRSENGKIIWYIQQSRDGFRAFQWGQDVTDFEDQPAAADYDGDGKCDIAVWRRHYTVAGSQSYFFIYYSRSGTVGVIPLGGYQDIPMPQDYDGDGNADPAVYSPSSGGMWYIQQSRDGFRAEQWAVERPIIGDYDGDGKADLAGYNRPFPETSLQEMTFYIHLSSSGNWLVEQFGYRKADVGAAPGDYDGDGKTDIAVYRGACEYGNGTWYWHRSSDGKYDQMKWGVGCTTDHAVPGDYDGDGKTDLAVYRRNGVGTQSYFYINETSIGLTAIPWGRDSDGSIFTLR